MAGKRATRGICQSLKISPILKPFRRGATDAQYAWFFVSAGERLFLGRHDINLSLAVAADWFERVAAPEKQLIWFEQSAHEVMAKERGKLFASPITRALPSAIRRGCAGEPSPRSCLDMLPKQRQRDARLVRHLDPQACDNPDPWSIVTALRPGQASCWLRDARLRPSAVARIRHDKDYRIALPIRPRIVPAR